MLYIAVYSVYQIDIIRLELRERERERDLIRTVSYLGNHSFVVDVEGA